MPTFHYEGVTSSGKNVKGNKDGVSRQAVLSELTASGIFISDIQESGKKKKSPLSIDLFAGKKNHADFFFQLSLLLRSGIPLVEALHIIARSVKQPKEKEIIMDTASKVSEGMRFSEALTRQNNFYDPMYVNLIKASENVGRLSQVLMDIAVYEETKLANADKLTSALVYPAVIMIFGIGVLVFLMTVIVPKMQGIFAATKNELPAITKVMLFIASIFQNYGLYLLILIIIAALAFRYYYVNNQKFRMRVDRRLFTSPLIAQSTISRFSHILSFQLKEGMPLTDALFYATQTVKNRFLHKVLEDVRSDVQAGVKFSKSVKDSGVFPELFPAAVSTGESTGNMPELLERVTEFYGKKIDKYMSTFLSVLEPVFILVIGLMVGFVVVSIMLPLMSIGSTIG